MNKFGIVLGVAAVATLAGCKDPDYKYDGSMSSQNEVKSLETTPTTPTAATPIESIPVAKCTCPPGTKHNGPCMCGSPDCKCIAVEPAVQPIVADVSKPVAPAPAAEATTYIVQRGDSLSKISKKYNITIASIRRANPKIKKDVVKVGQKITLPAKVDVGTQKVPEGAIAKPAKKVYSPFTGATKEYVVKNGDTLGAIAYSNGVNIRQLKELNGLDKNTLKVGQKLKIPADPKAAKAANAAATKAVKPTKDKTKGKVDEKKDAIKTEEKKPTTEEKKEGTTVPAEEKAAPAEGEGKGAEAKPADEAGDKQVEATAPAAPATTTYVVQEGDDITGVSIRWGVSAATIRELNNLSGDAQLVTGQILKLPAESQQ